VFSPGRRSRKIGHTQVVDKNKSVLIRVIRGAGFGMCRNIKTLHNFAPPATDDEIRASSLQFVRKLCGFTKPSQANERAFNRAVDEVTHVAHHLLESLVTNAPPRNRETEALKARARSTKRFGAVHVHNGNAHRHVE
jgi:hypothetical protein